MKPMIKSLSLFFFCILAVSCKPENTSMEKKSDHHYITTAKLPEDRQIGVLRPFSEFPDSIQVTAEFVESIVILDIQQGNYVKLTILTRYKITKKNNLYPYDELSFIDTHIGAASESGIKMKMGMKHFREGTKIFLLQKDSDVRYMDYFNIVSYTKD